MSGAAAAFAPGDLVRVASPRGGTGSLRQGWQGTVALVAEDGNAGLSSRLPGCPPIGSRHLFLGDFATSLRLPFRADELELVSAAAAATRDMSVAR